MGRFLPHFVAFFTLCICLVKCDYQIGVGIADCTGPVAEIIFMGYANLGQVGCGLHLRQFSRAYIIEDSSKQRVAFVTVDAQSMPHGIRMEVLKRLHNLYANTYTEQNLILSGTHTHGTPGGFMQDLMFDIPNLGHVSETFDELVVGIVQSVVNAHKNMVQGKIFVTSGELLDANINRSPAAYLYNPADERAKYKYDVDKEMVQVKFVRSSDNVPIGAINWFPVHATSMNNTNCLVTSDNVGYASILFETAINNGSLPGKGSFVGGFASTNLGDVSPNTRGPICINTGKQCDFKTSTCDGKTQNCIASGPGKNMVESTSIIAGKLFSKASELFKSSNPVEVTGPVKYIHQYVDMPLEQATITLANGTRKQIHGCTPAMGFSFAGGTTDGPGDFDFTQGSTTDNPFWDAVRNFLSTPTKEQIDCHHPKPILLNTGGITFPYSWQPRIVVTQLFTIGQLALIAVPGEFTTMSGRRLRDAVKAAIIANGGSNNTRPIITGLSNVYTNYIATPEEYDLQRYEAASTIFGPQTLNLYINKYTQLAAALMKNQRLAAGPTPKEIGPLFLSFVLPAANDGVAKNHTFGQVLVEAPQDVRRGQTVSVKFVSGNPRHDPMQGSSFLTVERSDNGKWTVVANDASWETRFIWKRTNTQTLESEVTIEWDVPANTSPGIYRIHHYGHYKDSHGVNAYEGVTRNFNIAA